MKAFISRIRIYPIKSLDPVELQEAEVGTHSLRYDREFAMLAPDGRFMNGKRSGRVNELKAVYDIPNYRVTFSDRLGGPETSFHLQNEQTGVEQYLSNFFGEPVSLVHNTEGQLMDIPTASSVTILSEATLQSLHKEFSDRSLEDVRLRFRATIELGGVEPYWEEKLVGEPGIGMRLTMGDVEMIGVSPRARCNVPPRDPLTGVTDKTFVRRMMKHREKTLPEGSHLAAYGSLYHLTINTYIPVTQKGKWLRVGDEVRILEPVRLESAS
ncbi:MAG: MOSC N-terminal beta barrel domain-containing protein [Cyclobacteriaceae bacterium]|nr:MOSC N-terminal beta barrel domain-containing protein [Cyclobacteriaceae bacterium]